MTKELKKIEQPELNEILKKGGRIDLSWHDLLGLNFSLDDGKGVFTASNLSGANFRGAKLINAYLAGANLEGANLSRANLWGANLSRANL